MGLFGRSRFHALTVSEPLSYRREGPIAGARFKHGRSGEHMIRYLPFVIELALVIFCLIDCIQTDSWRVRNLDKAMWILLIIFLPIIGSIAWLVAGRPQPERRPSVAWPSGATAGFPEYERPRAPRGPDDDPEFLRQLQRSNDEHEQLLKEWEADLRRRETEQRRGQSSGNDNEPEPDLPPAA